MQNEKGEPSAAARAIQKTLNRLLIATAVLYVILVLGGIKIALDGNETRDALCAFRVDLEKRTTAGLDFIRDHPQGLQGLSRAALLTQVTNQQRTIVTLQGLDCKEDTPVELLVIPPDLNPEKSPNPKSRPESSKREREAVQLAAAGILTGDKAGSTARAPQSNRPTPETNSGTPGPRGEPGPQGEQGTPGTSPAPTPSQPPAKPSQPSTPTVPKVPDPPAPVPDPPAPSGPIRQTVCGVLEVISVQCKN